MFEIENLSKVSGYDIFGSIEFEVLVRNAVKGERKALNDLCEAISENVFFLAYCMLGEHSGAEDVAQDALLDVCEYIETLREPKAFKKWLATIVMNKKNKYLENHLKHGVVLDISDYSAELLEEREEFIPDASLESAELRKFVKKLVMELPARQREAVTLRYYSDLTQREIAKIMDVNFQCVSQYLALAKKKIKGSIEKYMKSADPGRVKTHFAMPLGTILAGVLEQEAKLLGLANETVLQCMTATVAETTAATAATATLAGEAVAAEIIATGIVAETTAATAASLAATKSIGATTWICAVALTAMIATGVYVAVNEDDNSHGISPQSLQIILEGGTSAGEGFIRVNPQDALIGIDEVTILYWWITEAGSDEAALTGEGDTVSEGFNKLRETGERGRHILHIRSQSEGFTPHTSHISFYNHP